MPESSAWQELCRWEFGVVEEEEEEDGEIGFEPRDESSSTDENRSDITQLDRDNRVILLRAPASSKCKRPFGYLQGKAEITEGFLMNMGLSQPLFEFIISFGGTLSTKTN